MPVATELMGIVGIVLWVMVLVAQLRKKGATSEIKRRGKIRNYRP